MNEAQQMFLVKPSERVCCRCGRSRPPVLFPKTPQGAVSKVCQACTTIQDRKDEALLRTVCFRRHKRVVPLREKLKCGP